VYFFPGLPELSFDLVHLPLVVSRPEFYVTLKGSQVLALCDTGTSGQSRSDGNVELVRFLDSHEGDGVPVVFTGVRLLYRNNTPHDNPSKFAHR